MSDLWLKIRMLRLYRFHFHLWLEDVWRRDPLARQCCDGKMCGCYGSCWRDWWEYLLKERKP